MDYKDFLAYLVALGKNFPQLWLIVQEIVEKVQEAIAILSGPQPLLGAVASVTAEEAALERQLEGLAAGEGVAGIFDSGLLRQLFAFLKENPELLSLILSLMKK